MNAYELADKLENELNLSENLFVFDAADMLRQQADRIAELENVSSKPVAWTDKRNLSQPYPHSDQFNVWGNAYPEQGIDIPLYTHPVKQLTLDMIYKVSEATPINNEDDWFDTFAKNLIKEISND